MMKMTDLMHLPGLRFLDLEQVTEFWSFKGLTGPKNDATWLAEESEKLPRSLANQHGLQCRGQVRKSPKFMSDKEAC